MKKKIKPMKIKLRKSAKKNNPESKKWHLKLYIAGKTERSECALRTLGLLCETYLQGGYQLEVIDLIKFPQLAKGDQIFALPTLIKKVPKPVRKIIGDLSDMKKVLVGLDLQPIEAP